MKIIFPIFALWLFVAMFAWAQDGGVPAVSSSDPRFQLPEDAAAAALANAGGMDAGDVLVRRAALTIAKQASIQARVRYQVDLFGQHTIGEGIYLQQGAGNERQFCLQLQTPVGQQRLTFTQVCDGKFLWQYQESSQKPAGDTTDGPTISRIDLRRVRQAIEQTKHRPQLDSCIDLSGAMALGGLPRLIDGLSQSFHFTRCDNKKLGVLPVWVAQGGWKPEGLEPFSKELADLAAHGEPLLLNKIPPQLPEEVRVFIGQDDLFPYRVEYRRRTMQKGKPEELAKAEKVPIMVVEFFEVRLGVPIDPQQFVYQPAGAVVVDATAIFIKGPETKK
ncbi:MAG TPA: hypothetical protein VGJ15_03365 [Pirellulales bacterium]|jgi:hypothetical protein